MILPGPFSPGPAGRPGENTLSRVRRLGAADGRAFTLVETVMALGIAMLFLAAIFTLLSVGLTTSKDASDDTVIGLILRDVANRIRGEKMNASAPPRNGS
jgi:hypothetical protein